MFRKDGEKMSEKNIGTFQPNNNANPKGKPKGRTFTTIMREMALELGEGEPKGGKTKKQLIIEKLLVKAVRGERWAVELLWERLEGKAVQQMDVTSGGQSLNAAVSFCKVGEIPVQVEEVKTVDALPAGEEVTTSGEVISEEPVRKKIQW
jgi:hypothetical protein